MRKWFQNLSDTMVDRLVPKAEASAAVTCRIEEECIYHPVCSRGQMAWRRVMQFCSDGTHQMLSAGCGNCSY
ncbi:hypothetical protein ABT354_24140 [Streptomyces sp. NPDC000594]|uniref:hypothetical protein n=1 Tax=Streptomyces sp. NPDC000594 TaxID=3154261 RepID=UPI00331BB1CF